MGIFSKFFTKKTDPKQTEQAPDLAKKDEKKVNKFHQKIDQVTALSKNLYQKFLEEVEQIKIKLNNLLETNYKLGLSHIERGNISDAIFRFKFIKRFWPHCFDAYYQLAYAYVLYRKPYRAKEILKELIEKCPDYADKANELLNQIENSQKNATS